ncbi:hypothetical protein BH11ARM1_BH11ARM1_14550 [soil metagenome]
MTSSEVLDASLRLYQRRGLTFLRLSAVPTIFCLAAITFVIVYVLPALGTTKNATDIGVQTGEVAIRLALAVFIGGPLFLVGLTYATIMVVKVTSEDIEGRECSDREAEQTAQRLLGRMFWLNMRELLYSTSGIIVATAILLSGSLITMVTPESSPVAGLVAVVGLIGFAVGGLIFLSVISRDAVAVPCAVIEDLGAKQAGKRSRALLSLPKTKNPYVIKHGNGYGNIWNVYFLMAMLGTASYASIAGAFELTGIQDALTGNMSTGLVKTVIESLITLLPVYLTLWALIPIWATTITLVYYERRIRLEGFDIESLARPLKSSHDRANRFNV